MAIEKISDSTISANGVISAPDTLTGTAAENKAVFDRLTGKTAIPKVNEVIDEVNRLTGQDVFTVKAPDGSIVYMRLNSDKVLETSTDGVNFEATGSSGHVVLDAGGRALPQRSRMQFAEGTVEDVDGVTVVHGERGPQGIQGVPGNDGKNAYDAALDGGYQGTETQFNAALAQMNDFALAADVVPKTRKINNLDLSADRTLTGENIAVSTADSTPISGAVKYRTNPNLLDNWYFGRPVNQRGKTELASGNWDKYFIDRWIASSPDHAYTITDDGIKISNMQHKYMQIWRQNLERMEKRTYTLSFLLKNIGLLSITFTPQGSDYAEQTLDGGFIVSFISDDNLANPAIRLLDSTSVTVSDVTLIAAKLELGDTQTLAHKENGVWVLNEIPDFGEQLRRCQRYLVKLGSSTGYEIAGTGTARNSSTCNIVVPIPVTMRAVPAAILSGRLDLRNSDVANPVCTSVVVDANGVGAMYLACTANVTAGASYDAYLATGNYLFLSADL